MSLHDNLTYLDQD